MPLTHIYLYLRELALKKLKKLIRDIASSNVFATGFKLKCSVIIPVYKRVEFVEQALLSLESQNIDKDLFEVLIISNAEINLQIV